MGDRGLEAQETAGVIAPPPLIFLGGLVVGLLIGGAAPAPSLPRGLTPAVGIVAIAAGLCVGLWAARTMRRAGTAIQTRVPTTALVTTGPFAYSRNPLYVSMTVLSAGVAVAARSAWALVLLVLVLVVVRWGVIAREERYLERKFGDEYRRYKTRVRRWL